MAIRHWHPAKLIILWVLDLALLVFLWKPCETDLGFGSLGLGFSSTRCFHSHNLFLFIALISPVLIITWKWASAHETHPPLESQRESQTLAKKYYQVVGSVRSYLWELWQIVASWLPTLRNIALGFLGYVFPVLVLIFLISLPKKLTPYLSHWVGEGYATGLSILIVCGICMAIFGLYKLLERLLPAQILNFIGGTFLVLVVLVGGRSLLALKSWETCKRPILENWAGTHSNQVEPLLYFTYDYFNSFGGVSHSDSFNDSDSRGTAVGDAQKLGVGESELIELDQRIAKECGPFPHDLGTQLLKSNP